MAYGKIHEGFWTGETGRAITRAGPEARVVAAYLVSPPGGGSMVGVYRLPLPTLAYDIGIDIAAAEAALEQLEQLGFCEVDRETDHVFVCSMPAARNGAELKPGDKRVPRIRKLLDELQSATLRRSFLLRYGAAYNCAFDGASDAPCNAPSHAPSMHADADADVVDPDGSTVAIKRSKRSKRKLSRSQQDIEVLLKVWDVAEFERPSPQEIPRLARVLKAYRQARGNDGLDLMVHDLQTSVRLGHLERGLSYVQVVLTNRVKTGSMGTGSTQRPPQGTARTAGANTATGKAFDRLGSG